MSIDVIPAKAGIQSLKTLDPRLRGDDIQKVKRLTTEAGINS